MNTLYEYYTKTTDRYYTATVSGSFQWELKARKIDVKGYTDFDFFGCKRSNFWVLYEGLTGMPIVYQRDMEVILFRQRLKGFIDLLPAELDKQGGRAWLNSTIFDCIEDYGLSPRYEKG